MPTVYELNKHYSQIQESKIAKYLNWSVVSGSGARSGHPGDIKSDEWLGECKTHVRSDSDIVINFDVWNKISDEAQSQFKKPALFVDDGSQEIEHTLVLFRPSIVAKFKEADLNIRSEHEFTRPLEDFKILIRASKYRFIVINHLGRKYVLMELPVFKEYIGL